MLNLKANSPIGIFDSGTGGLTIARAVLDILPNESVIYFGDTAHLPYGDKSLLTIQGYVKKITDFLLDQGVKLILVACNTASAASSDMLRQYVAGRALVVNVIDPAAQFIAKNYINKQVGLIGTRFTVQAGAYQKRINDYGGGVIIKSLATPLLVPLIEEGFFSHELMDIMLSEYLLHPMLSAIDVLVLGCTHYPIIKNNIERIYKNQVEIIDSTKVVAAMVKDQLTSYGLLATSPPERRFYVSDYTEGFIKGSQLFFGDEINIEHLSIF